MLYGKKRVNMQCVSIVMLSILHSTVERNDTMLREGLCQLRNLIEDLCCREVRLLQSTVLREILDITIDILYLVGIHEIACQSTLVVRHFGGLRLPSSVNDSHNSLMKAAIGCQNVSLIPTR